PAHEERDRARRRSRLHVRLRLSAPGDDLPGPRRHGDRLAARARGGDHAEAEGAERDTLSAADGYAVGRTRGQLTAPASPSDTSPCRTAHLSAALITQEPAQGETSVPFHEKGDVRIRYEEAGSGFPLLVTPGGGLNSRVSNWPTAVFDAMEAFKNDFRCI